MKMLPAALRRTPRHMRNLLRLTGGEFENELAERVPHNRENGPKLIRWVHVFLGFTKITLNIPLPEETVGEFIVFCSFHDRYCWRNSLLATLRSKRTNPSFLKSLWL